MCPSLRGIDIIYKGVGALGIRIIMLHGNFHIYIVLVAFKIHNILIQRRFASV